ncbi:MAG TPA: sensor histidine kinase [Symbiobacteriaceae bacterium]|jgi:signal transduction histidine kinase
MSTKRIGWLAVSLPAMMVLLFEYMRHNFLESFLSMSAGNVVTAALAAAAMYGFVQLFKRLLERSAEEVAKARADKAIILERQRIAREMHDSVAQALFYLSVKLRDTETLVHSGDQKAACAEIQAMQGYTNEAYHLVKAVIADLKKQEEEQDLREAIRCVVAQASARLGLQVSCDVAGTTLTTVSQRHLLAIIQEALLNAHRHGRAHKADVRVRRQGRSLVVEVTDDGCGFDPSAAGQDGHFGLTIMAERARMIGGELELQSVPGRGTRVSVHVEGVAPA